MIKLCFSKNQVYLLIGIVIAILLTQCERSSENVFSPVSLDSLNINNYPRVDGSTSTHPLQVLIACEILGVEYQEQG